MLNKKKGNVLIVVVAMFAFISILIMSVMTMTTGGFKLRKDESARIENFYGADSGIDIAESITVELIEEAIEKGNDEVESYTGLTDEQKNEVFRHEYANYIKVNFTKEIDNTTETSIRYDKYEKEGQPIKVAVKKFEEVLIDNTAGDKVLENFAVALESSFKDDKDKDRIVSVNYTLDIPDYGVETIEKPFVSDKSNLLDYLIATDGNLYMDINGSTAIYGDLWVNGRDSITDRFERGIHIKGGSNKPTGQKGDINIDGKVITRGAISLNNTIIDFHENTYSRDFKVTGEGNVINGRITSEKNTDFKTPLQDIYVYNDLVFESVDSKLNMKNYYGLNDINEYETGFTEADLSEAERSSSIIVNSEDFGSNSKIKMDEMYVSGTAYIGGINPMDGLKNYQSGESVVINRNTKPYTDRQLLESMTAAGREEYLFKYKSPLHIVDQIYIDADKDYRDLNLNEKIELVEKHYGLKIDNPNEKNNEMKSNDKDLFNGIEVTSGNIRTTGVGYANGKAHGSNTDFDLDNQQEEFVKEVYYRNTKKPDMPTDFWNKPEDINVSESINWNAISKLIKKQSIYNTIDGDSGSKLHEGEITEKEMFKKQGFNYGPSEVKNNIGIFATEMTLSELLHGQIELDKHNDSIKPEDKLNINIMSDISGLKVKLIFNNTNKEIMVSDLDDSYKNNIINVKSDFLHEIAVVISKESVEVFMDEVTANIYSIILSGGDLRYKMNSSGNLGSFSQDGKALNIIFKRIFDFGAFENILGGGDGTGDVVVGESNTVVYPSDLIKDKVWDLKK
ncbi:pilus assembly PilX N-terminal domain-containing protein [uncultured Clostridium sp.]|jgi:hypothetical protein|uniref:pilus assembly PilX N-terminal domain-containing protein n=1 Tax=uncultured Clostridium sp. TaxID=59620 RepID=UPI002607ADDB|nr:pilus assembly PilX N-terminal domain-containing protein [uncultured Clostridium sp.]